jgi:HEAT repeat protein
MNSRTAFVLGIVVGCLIPLGCAAAADQPSTEALVAELKSADESARLQVIDQLGAQAATEAVEPLSDVLKDASPAIRAHAAAALGEVGEAAKPAAQALVGLLADSDAIVRQQAVKALMRIRPGPRIMVPLCVRLLEDSDPGVRMRVLNAISDVGPKAVPGLIVALKNDKAAYWACLILREIGPAGKDAVPALREKLGDKRPEIRREAILTLASMDAAAAPAVPEIAAALADADSRTAATYALGRIGKIPSKAEKLIRDNAKSDDKVLATTSLWALARVHPDDKELRRDAAQRLIEGLKDADPLARVAAARALAALPPAPEITMPLWEKAFKDADDRVIVHALDAMAALGPAAVPRLIEGLKNEKAREHVAYVLGRIGPAAAPAVPALTSLISDPDERVAQEAILALAAIGPDAKAAVPSLISGIKTPDNPNAHAAAFALGKIGKNADTAVPALIGRVGGSDPHLALVCAWALVNIKPDSAEITERVLPVLTKGLTAELPLARLGAAQALGKLGPAANDALPALEKATHDKDNAVREAAAKAIEQIAAKATSEPSDS